MFPGSTASRIERNPPVTAIFDQWLLNALSQGFTDGLLGRVRYFALRAIRRLRLAFSDPVVSTTLGKCHLQLPLSHELPLYRRKFPAYSANLGRITAEVKRKYPNLTMIDIGANVGDSVAMVRMFSDPPILCVEGEPRFFRLLAENTRHLAGIELEQTFLGATGDHIRAINVHRGNAQVFLGPEPGTGQICTLREVLARHPRFASTKFLKLDAEGFDCKILAAELELLKRNKPVLFFEYYPRSCQMAGQDALQIFPALSEIGYSNLLIYQNIGRYFMTLRPDLLRSIEDLHHFLLDLEGFCDVAAFHKEDEDLAARVRAAEYAARARRNGRTPAGNAV